MYDYRYRIDNYMTVIVHIGFSLNMKLKTILEYLKLTDRSVETILWLHPLQSPHQPDQNIFVPGRMLANTHVHHMPVDTLLYLLHYGLYNMPSSPLLDHVAATKHMHIDCNILQIQIQEYSG